MNIEQQKKNCNIIILIDLVIKYYAKKKEKKTTAIGSLLRPVVVACQHNKAQCERENNVS